MLKMTPKGMPRGTLKLSKIQKITRSHGQGVLWGSPWDSLRKNIKKTCFADTLQPSKFEYRSREVVKITVPVNLRKEVQHIAEVLHLKHFVATLGAQMLLNVSLRAFEWSLKFCVFFRSEKSLKGCPKGPQGRQKTPPGQLKT